MSDTKKSPFNEAVGKLISIQRERHQQDLSTIASAFSVSPAYLRQIESGARALPAYAAVGLVRLLGIEWNTASAIVAVADYLDTREGNGYDFGKMATRIEQLREVCPNAQYQKLFDLIAAAVRMKEANDDTHYPAELVKLREAINELHREKPSGESASGDVSRGVEGKKLSDYGMTPVFEDIVDMLADRLGRFPPHVNKTGIEAWERKNRHRICGLYGYMSEQRGLIKSIAEFDWAFVGNGHAPEIRILVGNTDEAGGRKLEQEFRKGLISKNRRPKSTTVAKRKDKDIKDRVHVLSADSVREKCSELLMFDFVTRTMPAVSASSMAKLKEVKRIRAFDNAWIYEVQSDSLLEDSKYKSLIGFLDTYDTAAESAYAVAIDRKHILSWLEVIKGTWSAPHGAADDKPE
jgi:hypothetical protein